MTSPFLEFFSWTSQWMIVHQPTDLVTPVGSKHLWCWRKNDGSKLSEIVRIPVLVQGTSGNDGSKYGISTYGGMKR